MVVRGLLILITMGAIVGGLTYLGLSELRDRQNRALNSSRELHQQIAAMSNRVALLEATREQEQISLPAIQAASELDAELSLQNRILNLAATHDLAVNNFGVGPVPIETAHRTLGFELEFEAAHNAAMALLSDLEASKPPLALHSLWVRQLPLGTLGDIETPVSVRLSLWSFWKDTNELTE